MNSPGDIGGHDSSFAGMYETDSNYRWRKVRGNLDLFVMERNERWKWQKMSKSRRRTPVYEGFYNEPPPNEDVYKSMPESARTRSRAESRQRMREELDTYFYDRWKTADERQQGEHKPKVENRLPEMSNETKRCQNMSMPTRNQKAQSDFYQNENQLSTPGYQYPGNDQDASKWSRYGYTPVPNQGPQINSFPSSYQNQTLPDWQTAQPNMPRHYLQDKYADSKYSGSKRFLFGQDAYPNTNGRKNRFGETYNPYRPFNHENTENYDQYWSRRSPRVPPYVQREPGYANYGYSPDYISPSRHYLSPYSQQNDFQPHAYNYQAINDRWDAVAETYKTDDELSCSERTTSVEPKLSKGDFRNNIDPAYEEHCRSRRRPRGFDNSYFSPFNTESSACMNDLTQSRRRMKLFGDVSTVNEEDDDVFTSPDTPPNKDKENNAKKWADQSQHDTWNGDQSSQRRDSLHKNVLTNAELQTNLQENLNPEEIKKRKIDALHSHYERDVSPQDHFKHPNASPSTGIRLPPLQAEHLASLTKSASPMTPFLSPGSSCLSANKEKRNVQSRSSKRVAFANNSMQENENIRTFTSRCERELLTEENSCASAPRAFTPERELVQSSEKPGGISTPQSNVSKSKSGVSLAITPAVADTPAKLNTTAPVNQPTQSVLFFNTQKIESEILQQPSEEMKELKCQDPSSVQQTENTSEFSLQKEATIHVGDIDGKSDVYQLPSPALSSKSAHQNKNNDTTSILKHDEQILQDKRCVVTSESSKDDLEMLMPEAVGKVGTPFHEQILVKKNNFNAPAHKLPKTRSSLWQRAKSLHRRMGTKLNLRREQSKLSSSSGDQVSLPISKAPQNNKNMIDDVQGSKEENVLLQENEKAIGTCVIHDTEVEDHSEEKQSFTAITSLTKKPVDLETGADQRDLIDVFNRTTSNLSQCDASKESVKDISESQHEQTDFSEEHKEKVTNALIPTSDSETKFQHKILKLDDNSNSKKFYEEEKTLEEQRKINEETTKRLLNDQREMESDLQTLRHLLHEEMNRQKLSDGINAKFNEKIDNLEHQIADLDLKLSETTTLIKEKETERKNLHFANNERFDAGLPPNAPLFIFSDPQSGTAAAVTQGNYPDDDSQGSSTIHPHDIIPYSTHFDNSQHFNPTHYGQLSPPSYVICPDQLDATTKQQEELKADLENQMANLKAALERQLQQQQTSREENSEKVIDARVTLLEKQIEEMNGKIQGTELIIRETEEKIHLKRERGPKTPSLKSEPNLNDVTKEGKHKRETKPVYKRSRSINQVSPRISPCPTRRLEVEENTRNDTGEITAQLLILQQASFNHSTNSSISPQDVKSKAKQDVSNNVLDDQSDDKVILLVDDINEDLSDDAGKTFHSKPSATEHDSTSTSASVDNMQNHYKPKETKYHEIERKSYSSKEHDKTIQDKCELIKESELTKEEGKDDINTSLELSNKLQSDRATTLLNNAVSKQNLIASKSVEGDLKSYSSPDIATKKLSTTEQLQHIDVVAAKDNAQQDDLEQKSEIKNLENKIHLDVENKPASITLEQSFKDPRNKHFTCVVEIDAVAESEDKKMKEANPAEALTNATADETCNNAIKDKDDGVISTLQTTTSNLPVIKKENSDRDLKTSRNIPSVSIALHHTSYVPQTTEFIDLDDISLPIECKPDIVSNLSKAQSNNSPCSNKNLPSNMTENEQKSTDKSDKTVLLNSSSTKKDEIHALEEFSTLSVGTLESDFVLKSGKLDKTNEHKVRNEKKPIFAKRRTSRDDIATLKLEEKMKDQKKPYVKPLQSSTPLKPTKSTPRVTFSTKSLAKSKVTLVTARAGKSNSNVNMVASPTEKNSISVSEKGKSEVPDEKKSFTKRLFRMKPATNAHPQKLVSDTKKDQDNPVSNTAKTVDDKNVDRSKVEVNSTRRFNFAIWRRKKDVAVTKCHPDISTTNEVSVAVTDVDKKTPKVALKKPESEIDRKDSSCTEGGLTSWLKKYFKKVKPSSEEIPLDLMSKSNSNKSSKEEILNEKEQETDQNKSKKFAKWSSTSDPKPKSTPGSKSASSLGTSEMSSLSGTKTSTRFGTRDLKPTDREMTVTTIDSEVTEIKEDFSRIQSRNSNWASTSRGWDSQRRKSLLHGLGTNWCVCPKPIWKHLGDEADDEPITRRKCISLIMGAILAILLLAIIVGLVVGLVSMQAPTESPIRFVVIPSELDLEDGTDDGII